MQTNNACRMIYVKTPSCLYLKLYRFYEYITNKTLAKTYLAFEIPPDSFQVVCFQFYLQNRINSDTALFTQYLQYKAELLYLIVSIYS